MKTAEKMVRDTKCVGCIAECHGLVGSTVQHFGDTLHRLAAVAVVAQNKKEFVRHFRVKKFTAGMTLGGARI